MYTFMYVCTFLCVNAVFYLIIKSFI